MKDMMLPYREIVGLKQDMQKPGWCKPLDFANWCNKAVGSTIKPMTSLMEDMNRSNEIISTFTQLAGWLVDVRTSFHLGIYWSSVILAPLSFVLRVRGSQNLKCCQCPAWKAYCTRWRPSCRYYVIIWFWKNFMPNYNLKKQVLFFKKLIWVLISLAALWEVGPPNVSIKVPETMKCGKGENSRLWICNQALLAFSLWFKNCWQNVGPFKSLPWGIRHPGSVERAQN